VSSSTTARIPLLDLVQNKSSTVNETDAGTGQLQDPCDAKLMAKVCDADTEALSLLFHRYARCVRAIGLRILRDRSEADDLVQEVFLYIHRKGGLFDPQKGSARSWIFQVAYT